MAVDPEFFKTKVETFKLATKMVNKALKKVESEARFEEILTLAAWLLQEGPELEHEASDKPPFGFSGGSYVEADFPEDAPDPLGLDGEGYDDDE